MYTFLSIDLNLLELFLGFLNFEALVELKLIVVLGLLESVPSGLLLLLDAKLGADPTDTELPVGNPEHLGLDQSGDIISLVDVVLVLLTALDVPEGSNVLTVGKILLGVGLQKEKLELEGVRVLLLLGNLDAGIIILGDDFPGELLLKESLAVLEGVIDGHGIHLLDHVPEGFDTLVGLDSLKGNIKGLLERVGLVGGDPERSPHLGCLDKCLFASVTNTNFDVVSAIGIGLVLAKVYVVNGKGGRSEYGRHLKLWVGVVDLLILL